MKIENLKINQHVLIKKLIKNIHNLRDDLDEVESHLNCDNEENILKAIIYSSAIFKCLENIKNAADEILENSVENIKKN